MGLYTKKDLIHKNHMSDVYEPKEHGGWCKFCQSRETWASLCSMREAQVSPLNRERPARPPSSR